jgi:hypothetical protein
MKGNFRRQLTTETQVRIHDVAKKAAFRYASGMSVLYERGRQRLRGITEIAGKSGDIRRCLCDRQRNRSEKFV